MSAGLFVAATLDWRDAAAGLDAMDRAPLRVAFAEAKPAMRTDQLEHKKAKSGPESPWAPRAAGTLLRNRTRKHARSLLGRLPTAVAYKATASSLTGESRIGFSDVIQEGGVVGHGARLTARVFLYLSDKFLDVAAGIFERVVVGSFGGRS